MSRSSMRPTTRSLLLALTLTGFATACDLKSPVDPNKGVLAPDHGAYGVTPSGISASTVSWSQIDVSWARTPSATGYQLFRADGQTGNYTLLTSTSATVTSYSNTGLTGSTQYCYEVRAVKTAGKNTTYSAFSSPACAMTAAPPPPPVAAPSETDAVPQDYWILTRWKDNSNNEDGFRVERAPAASGPWQTIANASANATSIFLYATFEQTACFRVIAFNGLGSSLPSNVDCTTPAAGPTNLTAKALDQQSITLTWTDNSAVEDGFRVSRYDPNSGSSDIANLPPNPGSSTTVTFRDASVAPDVEYTYHVVALKDGGLSPYSNDATGVVVTTAPAAPTEVQGYFYWDSEGYGWNYLRIFFTDNSRNEDSFIIQSSSDGETGWTDYGTTAPNSYYFEQQFDAFGSAPFPPPACYRVVAHNSVDRSSPSDKTCVEPTGAPTDLTATAVDQQTIDLTWTDNATLENGYVVLRSTDYYGSYAVIKTLSPNTTSFHDDTGVASGQEYWYLVAATYAGGTWSDYSNYASATTPAAGAALQASGTRIITRPAPISGTVRVNGHVTRSRILPGPAKKR